MPRPCKQRVILGQPAATVYKPAGVPAGSMGWTWMTLDEYEAVRLVDGEGIDQEQAAGRMGVSRPTVTRILASARSKLAAMLTGGTALAIEGGPVMVTRESYGMSGGGRGRRCGRGMGRGCREPGAARSQSAGTCVCPQCGRETAHQPGVPCASVTCPDCGIPLVRKT